MNALAQLALELSGGFAPEIPPAQVEKVPAPKQDSLSARNHVLPSPETRIRESYPQTLSWQADRAWETGIPQFGEF